MKKLTINTGNLDEVAPLYHQYPWQLNPQPAYIEIDPMGDEITIKADWSGEIGNSIPEYIFNGLASRITCPPYVLGSALADYLNSDRFAGLVIELCSDYEDTYRDGNRVGTWGDVDAVEREIEDDLLGLDMAEVFDSADWLADSIHGIDEDGETCHWSDAVQAWYGDDEDRIEITAANAAAIIEDINSQVAGNQVVVGADNYLSDIIDTIESNRN